MGLAEQQVLLGGATGAGVADLEHGAELCGVQESGPQQGASARETAVALQPGTAISRAPISSSR